MSFGIGAAVCLELISLVLVDGEMESESMVEDRGRGIPRWSPREHATEEEKDGILWSLLRSEFALETE